MADINFKWRYTEQEYYSDSPTSYTYGIPGEVGVSLDVNSNIPTLKISYYFVMNEYATGFAVSIDAMPSYDRFTGWTGVENKTYSSITTAGVTATIYVRWDTTDANYLSGGTETFTVYIPYPKPITEYTLTYNSNGGVGGPASVRIPDYVGTISISNKVPTRNGYIFKCWNTAVNGGGSSYAYGDNIKLSNNITLYAIWQKMTIKLQYTGAGGATSSGADLYVEDTKWGERFYLASNQFERNCYRFIGWQLFRANAAQWLNTYNEWDSNYSNVKLLSEGDCIDTDIMSLGQATDGEYIIIYAQWERVVPKSYVFDGTKFKEVVSIKMFDGTSFKDIIDAKHF